MRKEEKKKFWWVFDAAAVEWVVEVVIYIRLHDWNGLPVAQPIENSFYVLVRFLYGQ